MWVWERITETTKQIDLFINDLQNCHNPWTHFLIISEGLKCIIQIFEIYISNKYNKLFYLSMIYETGMVHGNIF